VSVVGFSRLATVRPENFGTLLFACLLAWIVSGEAEAGDAVPARPKPRAYSWLVIPLVMLLWANLHGSFLCGLAVLGCCGLGRVLEVLGHTRSVPAVLTDREVRRWLGLCLLGTAATLVNPYGWGLWRYVAFYGSQENLRDLLEWQPMVLTGIGGREFALSWVVLLVVLRHSRCRVPVAHGLLLGVFALASVLSIRMLGWYAMVFGLVLVPHLADLWQRWMGPAPAPGDGVQPAAGRSWWYSLLCLLLIWIAFSWAPLGIAVMGHTPRTPRRVLDPSTPLALAEFLRAHPPPPPMFNPQWWGDWLAREGPDGLQPFVTTNVHLVPPAVWRDYQRAASAQPGWQGILDRYHVQTVVVDKAHQAALAGALRGSPAWKSYYEDPQSLVVVRAQPPAALPDRAAH
jgi:hypothetical protein